MECHTCGADVVEGQKFCQECGQSLSGVTEPTERFDPRAASAATTGDRPADDAPAGEVPEDGVPTGEADDASADDASADERPTDEVAVVVPLVDDATLPQLADLPTQEIDPREPLPDPTWAAGPTATADAALADQADPLSSDPSPDAASAAETDPKPSQPMPDAASATLADLGSSPAPEPDPVGVGATQTLATEDFVLDAHDTDEVPVVDATTVLGVTPTGTTDEFPAVFDGSEDVHHFPPAREPFKLRLMFVLAFFGAVATLMSSAADVTDIRTSRPVDGIRIGITTLSDIGVNLPIAGFTGGVVMALGGLLACYGFRWGAGLAGGGGLAVAGWAGLTIGLAEVPIAVAESITRTTTTQQFTLTVTRDLGFWLIISAGAIGLVVFAASLRLAGTGGRRSLNPWIAAVGAVSAVILAAGPLIPVGGARFADNFRSPTALIDLPTAYFGGRLGQLALIAFAGVVGFLLVRAYGLGLAAGGISVGVWLWISSLLGIGEAPLLRDEPLGIAAGNFGGDDTTPHGVTTVGMVLTLLMLLIAAVLATVQYRRDRARY